MEAKLVVATEEQLSQIITQAVNLAIKDHFNSIVQTQPIQDIRPFGDIEWLKTICPLPNSTIDQMSASNKIPGKIKLGKRVIYNKKVVLDWIYSQACKSSPSQDVLEQQGESQFEKQQRKLNKK